MGSQHVNWKRGQSLRIPHFSCARKRIGVKKDGRVAGPDIDAPPLLT
jgi:hypothetical protein